MNRNRKRIVISDDEDESEEEIRAPRRARVVEDSDSESESDSGSDTDSLADFIDDSDQDLDEATYLSLKEHAIFNEPPKALYDVLEKQRFVEALTLKDWKESDFYKSLLTRKINPLLTFNTQTSAMLKTKEALANSPTLQVRQLAEKTKRICDFCLLNRIVSYSITDGNKTYIVGNECAKGFFEARRILSKANDAVNKCQIVIMQALGSFDFL